MIDFADLEWGVEGALVSKRFGDIYFSAAGGPEESEHVFVQPNGIVARFQRQQVLTVAELGFGTGLNFLVSWQAWLTNKKVGALHYYSVEKYPLNSRDLVKALEEWPQLNSLSRHLTEVYQTNSKWQVLKFEAGAIELHLFIGDVNDFLEDLKQRQIKVEAWYLDGFSPSKNPEMWSVDVFSAMVDCSAQRATCSTFTAVGQVRRDLQSVGFEVEKIQGFGKKRTMLKGTLRN